jgi:hypothetical protein
MNPNVHLNQADLAGCFARPVLIVHKKGHVIGLPKSVLREIVAAFKQSLADAGL